MAAFFTTLFYLIYAALFDKMKTIENQKGKSLRGYVYETTFDL